MFEGMSKVDLIGYYNSLCQFAQTQGANGNHLTPGCITTELNLVRDRLIEMLEKEHANGKR